jgi:hypothetical protein
MRATRRTGTRALLGWIATMAATAAWVVACSGPPAAGAPAVPEAQLPHFTADSQLLRPEDWQTWVMVGASLGLSYDSVRPAPVPGASSHTFHTIFMQPWAYRRVQATGQFPENTMFILSLADASRDADPARAGSYEGERRLGEIHLKKSGLSSSGWVFYGFGRNAPSARMIPTGAACYQCHAANGDFDQVFTQFYPPLRHLSAAR